MGRCEDSAGMDVEEHVEDNHTRSADKHLGPQSVRVSPLIAAGHAVLLENPLVKLKLSRNIFSNQITLDLLFQP